MKSAQSPGSVFGPHAYGQSVQPLVLYVPFETAPWLQATPSCLPPNPIAAHDEAIHPDPAADPRVPPPLASQAQLRPAPVPRPVGTQEVTRQAPLLGYSFE